MASSADNSPEADVSTFSVPIIARLTVHIAGQGGKKKTTKKDTKTKEFSHSFSATKPNYLDFLTTVLTKHHMGHKLRVTVTPKHQPTILSYDNQATRLLPDCVPHLFPLSYYVHLPGPLHTGPCQSPFPRTYLGGPSEYFHHA